MNYRIFIGVVFLISCTENKRIKSASRDMERTIEVGAELCLEKRQTIKYDDIIAFNLPNGQTKVLRVIGRPNDKIEIIKGDIFINNILYAKPKSSREVYTIYLSNPAIFEKLKVYENRPYSDHYSMFSLTKKEYDKIAELKIVDSIYLLGMDSAYIQTEL